MDTKEKLTEIVKAEFDKEQQGIDLHDKLAALLKEKYTGKKITSRIEEQFKKAYPEYAEHYVRFSKEQGEHGLVYFAVWKKDFNTQERMFVGYSRETENYNPEVFEERDLCRGKAGKERNKQRLALLNCESALAVIARNIDRAIQLKAALAENIKAIDAATGADWYNVRDEFLPKGK